MMKKHRFIPLIAAGLLASGAAFADDTGESRTAGRTVDDTTITAQVKRDLVRDADIKGMQIDVDTNRGVVTLTGAVPTEDVKEKAEEIAEGTKGVKDVQNNLKVAGG